MKSYAVLKVLLMLLCTTFFCLACSSDEINEQMKQEKNHDNSETVSTKIVMEIQELHNGDAKIYDSKIVTSVGGVLTILNMDGAIEHIYPEVKTNWLDAISEDGLIVYGNSNKELGIVWIDEKYNLMQNYVLLKSENLLIDPTIIEIDGEYFIFVTEIQGTVNNADANVQNGKYTIHMYKLVNGKEIDFISEVISDNHNLEDVDVFYEKNRFYLSYEKEILDKGKSSINIIVSADNNGKKWENPIQLISAECDHEPAVIESNNNGYRIYYSSDREFSGESYMGGKIYYADFNEKFECLSKDNQILTETNKGILLYDVSGDEKNRMFLYTKNYLSTCDLIIEKEYIEDIDE